MNISNSFFSVFKIFSDALRDLVRFQGKPPLKNIHHYIQQSEELQIDRWISNLQNLFKLLVG